MISGVVCHGSNNECWSGGVMKCSCSGVCDAIWSDSCVSYCDLYLQECECNLDLLFQYLYQWWCLEVDLGQCLVLECCLLWCAGMLDGGILSQQSAAIWPYSSHSKQCTFGQWWAMWPNSWHWKHWSSPFDITLTIDEGKRVAVNCCAAWSFSTSPIMSARVWDPFS